MATAVALTDGRGDQLIGGDVPLTGLTVAPRGNKRESVDIWNVSIDEMKSGQLGALVRPKCFVYDLLVDHLQKLGHDASREVKYGSQHLVRSIIIGRVEFREYRKSIFSRRL